MVGTGNYRLEVVTAVQPERCLRFRRHFFAFGWLVPQRLQNVTFVIHVRGHLHVHVGPVCFVIEHTDYLVAAFRSIPGTNDMLDAGLKLGAGREIRRLLVATGESNDVVSHERSNVGFRKHEPFSEYTWR